MPNIDRLITGFRSFRSIYYEQRPELFEALKKGQQPEVMVIACSDSRVDPAILTQSQPGELFVVRNVANVVPPYEPDEHYHGTSAALEFAVRDLGVKSILVLGHSQCGGIRGLAHSVVGGKHVDRDFIGPWMSIVRSACSHTAATAGGLSENLANIEQAAIRLSLNNLRTYPWIREKIERSELAAHGWWFELEAGKLWYVRESTDALASVV
jgi:carbonic anhydrase